MKKKIIFIMNPISGTVSKTGLPELIERTIDKDKFQYEIVFTDWAGHATELAADAVRNGIDIVVAVGGDGTVNEIGRALVHTDTAMAIVPCGSGNGLARHLMLPMSLKKSVETINRCVIHDLDYGVINGIPFFCTCGMGFDAFVSMKFAEAGKRGPITYAENVLREGLRYKPETYTITDGEGTKRLKAFLIACANASQYGNNAYIAPQASMSDGLLDVIIMEPFDVFDAPQISMDLFAKTIGNNSKIKTLKADKLIIRRENEGYIHFDGDPIITGKEIEIHTEHKGIKIVVNPDADKSRRTPARVVNAISEAFNMLREDIDINRRSILVLNKKILRRLNNL
ncbi:MAG: diacylglycerol kinase family protein [Prevotella sp.]|uniref:diacylglycerol/lipid kinase family protein n=1 Tax=Prevotella sp. TaxID=59823 RepID=UPI002A339E0F|nr:diacylglycerol kinase family protein [Prevotella sp.]MDD7318080.1 diacylglycerol kinase family protein [Prevotellaceae bacterium]MDY4021031.1 diacylglycerol kinase family protein [Prevotella sp.]